MNTKQFTSLLFFLLIMTGLACIPARQALSETFSIVVLPDTQFYTEDNPNILNAQIDWILANRGLADENIIYVAHLGDLKDDNDCDNVVVNVNGGAGRTEWQIIRDEMQRLRDVNVPHSVLPGNHDFDQNAAGNGCNLNASTDYTSNFGPAYYAGQPYYGGSEDVSNRNNVIFFQSPGGVQFMAINLAYSNVNGPAQQATLDWADTQLKLNPGRKAIITSHFILTDKRPENGNECRFPNEADAIGTYGTAMWDRLKENPNLFLMLSGHCRGERWVTMSGVLDRPCMDDVNMLMSNYQSYNFGSPAPGNDSGYLRIMRFDTTTGIVAVETFSPWIEDNGGSQGTTHANATAATMTNTTVSNFTFDFSPAIIHAPSIALLLDTSGSMSWNVNGQVGVPQNQQRIHFAKESAKAFLDLMLAVPANAGKANFSINTFPAHPSSGCNAQLVTGLSPAIQSSIDTAVDTTIPNLGTENGTPLLNGLEQAANSLDGQSCRSILVLSDGYHNCPDTVSTGDAAVASTLAAISGTRVYSVGFGRPGDTDDSLLQYLADETAGLYYDATNEDNIIGTWTPSAGLTSRFKEILAEALNLQTAMDPLGIIGANETREYPISINEHDHKVSFFLSWQSLRHGRLSMQVFDSSNQLLSPTDVNIASGKTYTIMTVDKRVLQQPGRVGIKPWRIVIRQSQINITSFDHVGSITGEFAEPYQFSVIVDSGLEMQARLDQKRHAAGDAIMLTARLREGRRAITDLSNVEVVISTPLDGKGNWLAANNVSAKELDRIPAVKGSEKLAPFIRKGLYLNDIRGIKYPGRRGPLTMRLFDDGSHGDKAANDGVYSNRFTDTGKEGIYSFLFRSHGATRNGNRFNREVLKQKYLSVRSTPQTIVVNVAPLGVDDLKRFRITVTPKDPLGNYLGPGHAGLIQLAANRGNFIGVLHDNLDGSYSQTLAVTPITSEQDVDISVTVDDTRKDFKLGDQLFKYAWSVHVGRTFPQGNFSTLYDSDISLGVDLTVPWRERLSFVGTLQYNRFKSSQAGIADTDWWSLNGDVKYDLSPPGGLKPFISGGIGAYIPESGSTEPGIHVGFGIERRINARWSWEIAADYHNIFTSGNDVRFSVIRAGLNLRLGGN